MSECRPCERRSVACQAFRPCPHPALPQDTNLASAASAFGSLLGAGPFFCPPFDLPAAPPVPVPQQQHPPYPAAPGPRPGRCPGAASALGAHSQLQPLLCYSGRPCSPLSLPAGLLE